MTSIQNFGAVDPRTQLHTRLQTAIYGRSDGTHFSPASEYHALSTSDGKPLAFASTTFPSNIENDQTKRDLSAISKRCVRILERRCSSIVASIFKWWEPTALSGPSIRPPGAIIVLRERFQVILMVFLGLQVLAFSLILWSPAFIWAGRACEGLAMAMLMVAIIGATRIPVIDEAEFEATIQRVSPDDVCQVRYTSGTTGDPKGVVRTYEMMAARHDSIYPKLVSPQQL